MVKGLQSVNGGSSHSVAPVSVCVYASIQHLPSWYNDNERVMSTKQFKSRDVSLHMIFSLNCVQQICTDGFIVQGLQSTDDGRSPSVDPISIYV